VTEKVNFLPDTNVVLRYFLRDDPEQFAQSETFFEKVRNGRARVIFLEGVLVECLYVLTKHYKVTRSEAAQALVGLLQYKGVTNPDRTVLTDGLQRFGAGNLDPVDCFLLARSRGDGLQIFSFDKELNKAAAKIEQL